MLRHAYNLRERSIPNAHLRGPYLSEQVGAIDSIIDTVGVCLALKILNVDVSCHGSISGSAPALGLTLVNLIWQEVCCSALPFGSGAVRTAHGLLPVSSTHTAYSHGSSSHLIMTLSSARCQHQLLCASWKGCQLGKVHR